MDKLHNNIQFQQKQPISQKPLENTLPKQNIHKNNIQKHIVPCMKLTHEGHRTIEI